MGCAASSETGGAEGSLPTARVAVAAPHSLFAVATATAPATGGRLGRHEPPLHDDCTPPPPMPWGGDGDGVPTMAVYTAYGQSRAVPSGAVLAEWYLELLLPLHAPGGGGSSGSGSGGGSPLRKGDAAAASGDTSEGEEGGGSLIVWAAAATPRVGARHSVSGAVPPLPSSPRGGGGGAGGAGGTRVDWSERVVVLPQDVSADELPPAQTRPLRVRACAGHALPGTPALQQHLSVVGMATGAHLPAAAYRPMRTWGALRAYAWGVACAAVGERGLTLALPVPRAAGAVEQAGGPALAYAETEPCGLHSDEGVGYEEDEGGARGSEDAASHLPGEGGAGAPLTVDRGGSGGDPPLPTGAVEAASGAAAGRTRPRSRGEPTPVPPPSPHSSVGWSPRSPSRARRVSAEYRMFTRGRAGGAGSGGASSRGEATCWTGLPSPRGEDDPSWRASVLAPWGAADAVLEAGLDPPWTHRSAGGHSPPRLSAPRRAPLRHGAQTADVEGEARAPRGAGPAPPTPRGAGRPPLNLSGGGGLPAQGVPTVSLLDSVGVSEGQDEGSGGGGGDDSAVSAGESFLAWSLSEEGSGVGDEAHMGGVCNTPLECAPGTRVRLPAAGRPSASLEAVVSGGYAQGGGAASAPSSDGAAVALTEAGTRGSSDSTASMPRSPGTPHLTTPAV